MKKDIKASDIIIRLVLLFMWPYGIIPLALSKRIKHKVCLAFIYFALCCMIGLPILMCVLLLISGGFSNGDDIAVAKNWLSQWLSEYFLYGIVILAISLPIYIKKLKQDKSLDEQKVLTVDTQRNIDDFAWQTQEAPDFNSYQKAQVLTEREKNFYETIRLIAEKHNLNVSAKMRLADIVKVSDEIKTQSSLWWSNFEKISQKHIDFALQDKTNLEIKLLIEIDDYTHQREDRIERDNFVDSVCEQANIPILHLYDVTGLEEKIVNILHGEKTEQEM